MLTIRLQRTGRANLPTYRVVVVEHSKPASSSFLEILGHYLPKRDPHVFEVNNERISHWISKGARPSDTVARLLQKAGVDGMEKFIEKYTKKRSKSAPPEEEAAPEAPVAEAAPTEETPATEPAPAAEEPKEEEKPAEAPAPTPEESKEEPAAPVEEAPAKEPKEDTPADSSTPEEAPADDTEKKEG